MDALVSKELLTNTFIPNTPLHDGAVIIRNGRILAAGCYLPLSSNPDIAKELGTRHRAAIGVTEETDRFGRDGCNLRCRCRADRASFRYAVIAGKTGGTVTS